MVAILLGCMTGREGTRRCDLRRKPGHRMHCSLVRLLYRYLHVIRLVLSRRHLNASSQPESISSIVQRCGRRSSPGFTHA